ncbi:hypothetical protein HDU97_000268 [Phlyctochytrium planicorne]|nr:hypothetical protein HDU97_000268 [Phlyctochytrium planicorne]
MQLFNSALSVAFVVSALAAGSANAQNACAANAVSFTYNPKIAIQHYKKYTCNGQNWNEYNTITNNQFYFTLKDKNLLSSDKSQNVVKFDFGRSDALDSKMKVTYSRVTCNPYTPFYGTMEMNLYNLFVPDQPSISLADPATAFAVKQGTFSFRTKDICLLGAYGLAVKVTVTTPKCYLATSITIPVTYYDKGKC